MKIHKGDQVIILAGKDKGKQGKVLHVHPRVERIVVDGLNIVKHHRKPKRQGEKGQIVDIPSPLDVSNVMLICSQCSKQTRPRMIVGEGQKERVCRKCQAVI